MALSDLLKKKLLFHQLRNQNSNRNRQQNTSGANKQSSTTTELSSSLTENLKKLRNVFGISDDIVIREFTIGDDAQTTAGIIFLEGMVDKNLVNESIIRPLMYDRTLKTMNIEVIKRSMLSVGNVTSVTTMDEVVDHSLSGETVFLMDGSKVALVIGSQGWETRGVEDPKTESIVRGPREGFSENIRINTSLLRRKIKSPNLVMEAIKVGKITKTDVCLVYINGVVNPKIVEEARARLKRIDTDAILESGYIEGYIEDAPFSIFATVANSERPDAVAAKLLEGRAAIIVDGTPFVLTFPMVFLESFQSNEDYYSRPYYASMVRLFRFIAFGISVLFPATYVAVTTFHQELLPTPLLFTIASAVEGTPFPAAVEVLVMGIIFEILREAGIRLPRPVGQAISIVGALVIGESAVSAGLIGEPVVIIIALTAVSSFAVPAQTDSGAILRVIFVLLAGAMGGFGIIIGLLGVLIHLASLRSFGTPYLSPLAPLSVYGLKDVFIRVPIWAHITRPKSIMWKESKRQKAGLRPRPSPGKTDDQS